MHHSISWRKTLVITLLISLNGILQAQPPGYYNGTENLSGENLKDALHEVIKNHVDFSYNEARYILNYTDADTANPNNVILFYLQQPRDANQYGEGGDYINREHVWAKSHGYFSGIRPVYSDTHNLRPADASVNEDRSNKDFDKVQPNGIRHSEATECWYSDSAWEPGPATKGQVARILFYMATRYEGEENGVDLELADKLNTFPLPQHGKLSTLLEWNNQYPPSNFERRRNERIYQIQQNRNPFIDNPDFANLIWNNKQPGAIQFSEFGMTPKYPGAGETTTILVKVNSATTPDNVFLFWGNSFDSRQNKIVLTEASGIYSGNISTSGFQPGETVYFLVKAFAGQDSSAIRGSYIVPESISASQVTPIASVQGTGTASPMLGQQVTVAGRVTANFDKTLYIRDNSSSRGGICIYNSLKTGNIGDSVVVRGTVTEYSTLTELSNIDYLYNFGDNKSVQPITLTVSQINEDYEGLLVRIENVTFSAGGSIIPDSNKSFTFSDGTGQTVFYSPWTSKLVGKKIPVGKVSLTGIVSQYSGTYQLLVRDIADFELQTGNSQQPKIQNQVEIYPNPATNLLNISTNLEIKSVAGYSAGGKMVFIKTNQIKQIDISALQPGIYFLKVETQEGVFINRKFIVR
jgi:endonuclease I